MVIILADESKPREPSDYDRIVCAEIPDTTLDSPLSIVELRCIESLAKKELFACEVVHVLVNFLRNSLKQLLPPPRWLPIIPT